MVELENALTLLQRYRECNKSLLRGGIIITGLVDIILMYYYMTPMLILNFCFSPLIYLVVRVLFSKKMDKIPVIVLDDIHELFSPENIKEFSSIAKDTLGFMDRGLTKVIFVSSEKSCINELQRFTGMKNRISLVTFPDYSKEFTSEMKRHYEEYFKTRFLAKDKKATDDENLKALDTFFDTIGANFRELELFLSSELKLEDFILKSKLSEINRILGILRKVGQKEFAAGEVLNKIIYFFEEKENLEKKVYPAKPSENYGLNFLVENNILRSLGLGEFMFHQPIIRKIIMENLKIREILKSSKATDDENLKAQERELEMKKIKNDNKH